MASSSLQAITAGPLQNLQYTYYPVGNINTISDSLTGELQSYDYDALDRLTSASVTNSYAYDQDGNMTTRSVAGQTFTLGYDAEGHLVTVTGPSMTASFVYDGDGARA